MGSTIKKFFGLTPLSIKGGLSRVIDSATGDIARTTSGYLENNEALGAYYLAKAGTQSGEVDNDVLYEGHKTIKLSTGVDGRAFVIFGNNREPSATEPVSTVFKYQFPVKPSTVYKLSCAIKTVNAVAVQTYVTTAEYNDAETRIDADEVITNRIGGDNDFVVLAGQGTTNVATTHITIAVRLNAVAGNISDAWFAPHTLALEEVKTITNPSASPANYYPKITPFTSKDNIDQSQVTEDSSIQFGKLTEKKKLAQQFIPTKKNLTGVIIKKVSSTGTYTGNVTISIQGETSSAPNGTILATITIPNATWEALSNGEYQVSLPCTLTPGTNYWIVLDSSTYDDSNYANTRIIASSAYSGIFSAFISSWTTRTGDLYFKTLYSKNTTNATIRLDTGSPMSITAPTTDGWAEGTVIDTATLGIAPLVLAPGVNNIYYSSNGPATADGTVDPSLQCIIGGTIYGSPVESGVVKSVVFSAAPTISGMVTIKDAVTSAETKLTLRKEANNSVSCPFSKKGVRFDQGIGVDVVGLDCAAYLEIE